jgi:hypothetical protein
LPFGEPIDLVVEEEDLDIEVPAEEMGELVTSDGKPVAIPADYPYLEIPLWMSDSEPFCDRKRSPVDGVESIGPHIVREPARTADPAEDHMPMRRKADLGQGFLEGA